MSDRAAATTDERRGDSTLSDAEKVALAEDNHIWVNAMMCVRPSDELYRMIGKQVLAMLDVSPIHGDMLGVKIGKVLYLRVNKS